MLLLLLRVASREEEGSWQEEENGCEEGEREDSPLPVTGLCLLLDHFTYLAGTQGNQKKVREVHR